MFRPKYYSLQILSHFHEFVEDPAILLVTVVDVDVTVAVVADMGVGAAFVVTVDAVDAVVADVYARWIDDVVVFAAAGAAAKSTFNVGIAEAVALAEDKGIVVIETIDQLILLSGRMNESNTRDE